MTNTRQVQLLHDAAISAGMFAPAINDALSRGRFVKVAMRHILYPGAKAAMYVHLISSGPGGCLPFP